MLNNEISYTKQITVDASYDVLVCGGGPSGIAACVAAARNGAKTCLVEQYGFLGGSATAALVNPISEFRKNGKRIIGGIPWEFVNRLAARGGARIDLANGNVPFDPEIYKLVAMEFVRDNHVDILLHSFLVDTVMGRENAIEAVIVTSATGLHAIKAKYFIDCTGNGDLASMAQMELQVSDSKEWQPGSLCFILANVDTDHLENIFPGEVDKKFYNRRIRDFLLDYRKIHPQFPHFGGPWFCSVLGKGLVSVNISRRSCNPLDAWEFSKTEGDLRKDIFEIHEVLKNQFLEFKDSRIVNSGVQTGIRESRRILGNYVLSQNDLNNSLNFNDVIAMSSHPIDMHVANGEDQAVMFLSDPVGIPYRCLYSDSHKNLLVAGRCISVDRKMLATVRVQAPVMGVGEAAGTAAAIALKQSIPVGQVDGKLLHAMLITAQND
jgi:hypothetical protein